MGHVGGWALSSSLSTFERALARLLAALGGLCSDVMGFGVLGGFRDGRQAGG